MAKNTAARREFVAALDRGLRVLRAFSRESAQLTLSEVASRTDLTPSTARRSLQTLEALGYVGRIGRRFLLKPKVLDLGAGYLSGINATAVLQPFLQEVVNEAGGSASVTVLDDLDIVFLARASVNRTIQLTAGVGTRYPAYPTAMGRILLAYQPEWVIDRYFERVQLKPLTEHTETSPQRLRRLLRDARAQGYATSQDELDYSIVAVAIPIFGRSGRIVAAAGCSDVSRRLDGDTMVARRLPALRQAVLQIEGMFVLHPELERSVESATVDHVPPPALARVEPQPEAAGPGTGRPGAAVHD